MRKNIENICNCTDKEDSDITIAIIRRINSKINKMNIYYNKLKLRKMLEKTKTMTSLLKFN